jgi:hypothetical protein
VDGKDNSNEVSDGNKVLEIGGKAENGKGIGGIVSLSQCFVEGRT